MGCVTTTRFYGIMHFIYPITRCIARFLLCFKIHVQESPRKCNRTVIPFQPFHFDAFVLKYLYFKLFFFDAFILCFTNLMELQGISQRLLVLSFLYAVIGNLVSFPSNNKGEGAKLLGLLRSFTI